MPPSRRNQKQEIPKTVTFNADSFPDLSSNIPTQNPLKLAKSFSSLATEWKEKEVEDTMERQLKEDTAKHLAERESADKRTIVALHRDYKNPEPYIYGTYESEDAPLIPVQDEGWKVIEKKRRKEWTLEEQIERKQLFEQEEMRMKAEEESVWASTTHRNEDWDHRDRRIN